jgi:hypothetical protein
LESLQDLHPWTWNLTWSERTLIYWLPLMTWWITTSSWWNPCMSLQGKVVADVLLTSFVQTWYSIAQSHFPHSDSRFLDWHDYGRFLNQTSFNPPSAWNLALCSNRISVERGTAERTSFVCVHLGECWGADPTLFEQNMEAIF